MNRSCLFFLIWAVFLTALPRNVAEVVYVVKKNDTLSEIATQYDMTVALLARRNHLDHPDRIFTGQKIIIPSKRPELDGALLQRLNRIQVTPHKWKYIVVHHSGSESGSAAIFDRYHREERHMENGLAYHFVIGNGKGMEDGEIAIGNRWVEQLDGGHLASLFLNKRSIGICLVGNFEEEKPTSKQMESLHALIDFLLDRCDLPVRAVTTHQHINTVYTRCPGMNFPAKAFIKELKSEQEN